MSARVLFLVLAVFLSAPLSVTGADLPKCLSRDRADSVEYTIAKSKISNPELLARLVYAESRSTGFGDDALVHEAIAWGVMNRVRLAEKSESMKRSYGAGLRGVIFKKNQFNPAVSPNSPFSRDFLCPREKTLWQMSRSAAGIATAGEKNPFIQIPWEQEHRLSLVVNFYYPKSVQARGARATWEGAGHLEFIGDVMIGDRLLPAEHIRFYRLVRPPTDVK